MDTMKFAMLLKKRGIEIDKEIGKYSIVEILDFMSEETQNILLNSKLCQREFEKLLSDSIKNTKISNIDNEIIGRLSDPDYRKENNIHLAT